MTFTDQQLATVLAALSLWQQEIERFPEGVSGTMTGDANRELMNIATNYGEFRNLDSKDIDDLIHAINNE